MSKHHNFNHNYTNYSKPQTASVESQVEETVEPEVVENVEAVAVPAVETVDDAVAVPAVEVVEPEVTQEPEEETTGLIGVVTECTKLNVRKAPNTDAAVVTTLSLGTEVMIDEENSTEEFYKVYTGTGVEGYCMKKFINTNS